MLASRFRFRLGPRWPDQGYIRPVPRIRIPVTPYSYRPAFTQKPLRSGPFTRTQNKRNRPVSSHHQRHQTQFRCRLHPPLAQPSDPMKFLSCSTIHQSKIKTFKTDLRSAMTRTSDEIEASILQLMVCEQRTKSIHSRLWEVAIFEVINRFLIPYVCLIDRFDTLGRRDYCRV